MRPEPTFESSSAAVCAEPVGLALALGWRRRQWLGAGVAGLVAAGCAPATVPPLRVGAHPWPGYELMYLARDRGFFSEDRVRLIELPSASASFRALATETLEGAALTLDEVLTARSRGIDLVVVAVLDVSHGADVVLGQPGLRRVTDLWHKRVGVEPGAVGALMLESMLASHGMTQGDVKVVAVAADGHLAAFRSGKVDALVTYEPAKTLLMPLGAQVLFSSAEIPGRIVDCLAVRRQVLAAQGQAVRALLAGHFRALATWQRDPDAWAAALALRLGLHEKGVAEAFAFLNLPDVAQNHAWLGQGGEYLVTSAQAMAVVMRRSGLLVEAPGASPDTLFANLADARFLPVLA